MTRAKPAASGENRREERQRLRALLGLVCDGLDQVEPQIEKLRAAEQVVRERREEFEEQVASLNHVARDLRDAAQSRDGVTSILKKLDTMMGLADQLSGAYNRGADEPDAKKG